MDETDNDVNNKRTPEGDEEDDMSFKEALREQERLGGVDTSINETIEAMKGGRDGVAQRFYRQEGYATGEDSTHPLDILRTGRKRILDKIANQANERPDWQSGPEPSDNESIRSLNRQLFEKLDALTSAVPQDPSQMSRLEMEIQAVLKAYQVALHKILTPLRFNRRGLLPRERF